MGSFQASPCGGHFCAALATSGTCLGLRGARPEDLLCLQAGACVGDTYQAIHVSSVPAALGCVA